MLRIALNTHKNICYFFTFQIVVKENTDKTNKKENNKTEIWSETDTVVIGSYEFE